jgi:hypothetical protein
MNKRQEGRFEEKNLFPPPGTEAQFLAYPAPSLDAILTEPNRLHPANNVLCFRVQ